MTSASLWARAAGSYQAAGDPVEAARCFHNAGKHLDAAFCYQEVGMFVEVAAEYEVSGDSIRAAWTHVHHLDDASAARSLLAPASWQQNPMIPLLRDLVLARCDITEGREGPGLVRLLRRVQEVITAGRTTPVGTEVEEWAVAVAEAGGRLDQVALIYAASVRGRRPQAAERWQSWSLSRLGMRLVLPAVSR